MFEHVKSMRARKLPDQATRDERNTIQSCRYSCTAWMEPPGLESDTSVLQLVNITFV